MTTPRRRQQSGFTLIELMVVVVIIAIVSSLALTALMNAFDRSRQRATMADMRTVSKAIEIYNSDHGFLPSDGGGIEGLQAVLIPYQSSVVPTRDHWHHPYHYAQSGLDYTLSSYGKDGVAGDAISVTTRHEYDRDIIIINGQFVASPE